MERMYSCEEAESLIGRMVVCDESGCDGALCKGHNIPHIYDDIECFHSCEWTGHSGLCVTI